MKRIQAKKYKIGTYEVDKKSLPFFDDKRFVLDDGVHTFHKDCNKECDKNENENKNENNINNNHDNDNDDDNEE